MLGGGFWLLVENGEIEATIEARMETTFQACYSGTKKETGI